MLALLDLVIYQVPSLMLGQAAVDQAASTTGSPPFIMVLLGAAFDVLGIVIAYGVWQAQRWAVILAIVFSAFTIIDGLGAALGAPDLGIRIAGGVGVLVALLTLVLCLWRERRQQGEVARAQ